MAHLHDWNPTPYICNAVGYHSKRNMVRCEELFAYEEKRKTDMTWYVGTVFSCRVHGCSTFLFKPHNPQFSTTECEMSSEAELVSDLAAA